MARLPLPQSLAPLVLVGILACAVLAKFDMGMLMGAANIKRGAAYCQIVPGLGKNQVRLCQKQPEAVAFALRGLRDAASECQYQFQDHRWNCSSLVNAKNIYGTPIFSRGYPETAFAHAISAAGVAISVSRACLGQDLGMNCCDTKKYRTEGTKPPSSSASYWKSKGCPNNLKYGVRFSKKFLDSREEAQDMQSVINLHNNQVGRLTVAANTRKVCKCHGVSGSCSLEICWKVVPNIRILGNALKERYQAAVLVDSSNSGNRRPKKYNLVDKGDKPRKRRRRLGQYVLKRKHRESTYDLLYYRKSPHFCEKDTVLNVSGTSGRFCNRTSSGSSDSCSALCCDRGYHTIKEKRTENCKCKFHWCCDVKCDTCLVEEWKDVCN